MPTVFRIMDCQSCNIADAPAGWPYVALGYMYDSGCHGSNNEFPATIRDAIAVTKNLDYKYLWVNQYCIKQEINEEEHCQINQIDPICRSADLIIIAAGGDA